VIKAYTQRIKKLIKKEWCTLNKKIQLKFCYPLSDDDNFNTAVIPSHCVAQKCKHSKHSLLKPKIHCRPGTHGPQTTAYSGLSVYSKLYSELFRLPVPTSGTNNCAARRPHRPSIQGGPKSKPLSRIMVISY